MKQFFVLIFAALVLIGCKKDDTTTINGTTASTLTISPTDNSAGINTAANIVVTFGKKIDPPTVQKNFHLISTGSLTDSMMPGNTMMNQMTMMSAMGNRSTMNYLDSVHSIHGSFIWNFDSTVCTFDPDSMFHSATQYMIHFDQSMVDMMEQRMGSMGMMGYNGSSTKTGMAFHFTTKITGSLSSDHDSHHP